MADLCVINVYDYGYSQTCLKTFIHDEQALTGDTTALLNISVATSVLTLGVLAILKGSSQIRGKKVLTNQTDNMYNVLRNGYVWGVM